MDTEKRIKKLILNKSFTYNNIHMAKISNHQTVQVNFVLIPEKPTDIYNMGTDELKSKIADNFPDSKAVITQFPEIFIMFDPNNQININIIRDQNRIIIGDNRVTAYSGRDPGNFFKFVKEAVDIINKNEIKGYGFNIISGFDLVNGEEVDSGKFIKDSYINGAKFSVPGTLESAGIKATYKDNDTRFELRMEPKLGQNMEPTKTIIVSLNSHFANKKLPEISVLQAECVKIYSELPGILEKLVSQ